MRFFALSFAFGFVGLQALTWIAKRNPAKAQQARERVLLALEQASERLRASSVNDGWFEGVDPGVRGVASGVDGHLFEQLLRAHGYHDVAVVDLFSGWYVVAC